MVNEQELHEVLDWAEQLELEDGHWVKRVKLLAMAVRSLGNRGHEPDNSDFIA